MNIIKTEISNILKQKIFELYNIELKEVIIDTPPKKDLWEYCFGCFILTKELAKSPNQIWTELIDWLKNSLFSDLNVAGPYLNFRVSKDFYTKLFLNTDFSIPQIWVWKNIVVDYIWTNIWKAMHIWHMCPSAQWQVTCNLYRALWYNVIWDSHLWDWWIIFWKLIYAYNNWWNEEKLKTWAVDYLQSLYIKATSETENNPELEEEYRKEFKKLSLWDKESIKLWELFTKYSLDNVQIQNDRLNVKSTYDIWESFYEWIWLPKLWDYPDLKENMNDIVAELISKKIAIRNEDWSAWVTFSEDSKLPSVMLEKRDGTHGYLASDITAVKYRMLNWQPEKIIIHADMRQKLHFKQVTEISKLANYFTKDWKETILLNPDHGYIILKSWAMSSRTWNIIKLEDLLDEAHDRARKIILEKRQDLEKNELEELSETIWIWSIKYGYLSKSRLSDMVFDWDEFMTFEWNSFPYVAYAYVRALRILEKAPKIKENSKNVSFQTVEEIELFKDISELNNVLLTASENIFYHNLVSYVYNLTKKFSAFYNNVNVISDENEDTKNLRLKLITEYTKTTKVIFDILWIKLPNKM